MSVTGCVYCYHNKQQTEVSVFNWEDTRHFVGTGMRRRGEIASSRDLTPGQVLVTWLREGEVAAGSKEKPRIVCLWA